LRLPPMGWVCVAAQSGLASGVAVRYRKLGASPGPDRARPRGRLAGNQLGATPETGPRLVEQADLQATRDRGEGPGHLLVGRGARPRQHLALAIHEVECRERQRRQPTDDREDVP
jgi:hypothetical protein